MRIVGARVAVVACGNVVPNKHIITNKNASSNEAMGTNNGIVADDGVILDFAEWADPDIIPKPATIEIRRVHDDAPVTCRHLVDPAPAICRGRPVRERIRLKLRVVHR